MSVLFVSLPVALFLAATAVGAFLWSLKKGQFDDLDTPRYRMLFDESPTKPKSTSPEGTSKSSVKPRA